MAFDMNQLFENPGFMFGASLLSNPRSPDAMNSAFGIAQKINDFKQQRDYQNTTLGQTAARDYSTAQYQGAEAKNMEAEAGIHQTQNRMAMQQQAMSNAFMIQLAKRFHMDPAALQAAMNAGGADPANPAGGNPLGQGAQNTSAQYNIPPNGNLSTPPIGQMPGENQNGMAGGAQVAPATPAPQGAAPPQQMPNFDPQAPADPAGPMTDQGGYGQPQLQAPNRPMMTTGAQMAPAIFGQESGNRNNISNSVNGAVGPGQMMPATFQRFARPGEQITNPQDNRAAATRYLDYLAAKAGGDPAKIAAGYFSGEGNMGTGSQPFRRNVSDGNGKSVASYVNDIMGRLGPNAPTGYTRQVLSGLTQPPAAGSGVQGPPMPNSGLEDAQLAMMMGVGRIPGAQQAMDYAKMEQPQNVPAESYQRDPVTGVTQFYASPSKEREMGQKDTEIGQHQQEIGQAQQRITNDTARLGNENAKTSVEVAKGTQDIAKEERASKAYKAADANHVASIDTNMGRMSSMVDQILKSPGLSMNAGIGGAIGMNRIPGTAAKDTAVQLETLKNKLVVDAMTTLKEASKTGSTGFGQLSEREGERLETMIANLDHSQSLDSLKKQLTSIKSFADEARGAAHNMYKNTYNEDYSQPRPNQSSSADVQPRPAGGGAPQASPAPQAAPAAPAAGVMGLNDYLAKHRK